MDATHPAQPPSKLRMMVVICTYNRAPLLEQTLNCMTELVRPSDCELQLLVVNNCCTDRTDEVVAQFSQRLPLTLVHEPKPGLSNARNRGIDEAVAWGADVIVWTDDDVRPYAEWLVGYREAYRRYPDAAVLGGPVEPWFEVTPPRWIEENWGVLRHAFAVRDLGPTEAALDPGKGLPFGANFSIRTKAQIRHRYDPSLGVVKGRRLAGEESVVMRAILIGDGGAGYWLPQPRVRHFIEAHRLTLSYVTRYFYGAGVSASIIAPEPGRRLMGRPRWLIRQAVMACLRLAFSALTLRRQAWVSNYVHAAQSLGQIADRVRDT